MNTKCEKMEDGQHCWHAISASIVICHTCCWCGESYTQQYFPMIGKSHGSFIPNIHPLSLPMPISNKYVTYYNQPEVNTYMDICSIEEFFKTNPNATSCLIACSCSRHRVIC